MGIRRLENFKNFLGAVGCEPHGQGMGAVGAVGVVGGVGVVGAVGRGELWERWELWEGWERWERWGASHTGRKSQRDSERL